jgi:predicted PurR-regulated permease PerM
MTEHVPQREVRVKRLVTIFVWAVIIVLVLRFFEPVRMILLGLLAASCMSSALRPLRRSIPGPRWLGGIIVGFTPILVVGGLITLLTWLLAPRIRHEFEQWPQYKQRLDGLLEMWSERFGLEESIDVQTLLANLGQVVGGGGIFTATMNVIVGLVIALAFIFIGAIYLLAEPPRRLMDPTTRLLPKHRQPQFKKAIRDLEPRLRWWLIGSLFSMTVVGVASFIGYSSIGLQPTLPLALLAAFSEIVPTVGPIFAFLIALLFAAAQEDTPIVGVLIVYAIIQTIEAYILTPLVMKKAVHIPPVVTLFTIVLWGQVFGPAGLLLAIPINLTLWSFAENFLMEQEPAAEPSPDTS